MAEAWVLALTLVGSSAVTAVAALILVGFRPAAPAMPAWAEPAEGTAFLFEDEALVDATPAARRLLEAQGAGADWARLMAFLGPRFPGIGERLAEARAGARIAAEAAGRGGLRLVAEAAGARLRILLLGPEAEGATAAGLDSLGQCALEDELAELRAIVEQAPFLLWRQAPDGSVTWANRAYLVLAAGRDGGGQMLSWPLPRLFEPLAADTAAAARRRARLDLGSDGRAHWFDLQVQRAGSDLLCFGLPADAAVQAELALRDFVQTLSRAFAHLPIGLAIFDRRRELMLFNPALADLTSLPPEFLAARPSLGDFLDRLRDRRMIPEPRDYRGWRQRLSAIEAGGPAGFHEETWTLPGGQTYRVTARPHADGGVAFLMEDISAEITATRQLRAQLDTAQAVFDSIDEAIAVFAPSGVLLLANAAYARLWGVDPTRAPGQIGLADALRLWEQGAEPAPFFAAVRRFVTSPGVRVPEAGEIRLRSGARLAARLRALPGGAALVGFAPQGSVVPASGLPAGRSDAIARIPA